MKALQAIASAIYGDAYAKSAAQAVSVGGMADGAQLATWVRTLQPALMFACNVARLAHGLTRCGLHHGFLQCVSPKTDARASTCQW
jgi:hypothetical protein